MAILERRNRDQSRKITNETTREELKEELLSMQMLATTTIQVQVHNWAPVLACCCMSSNHTLAVSNAKSAIRE